MGCECNLHVKPLGLASKERNMSSHFPSLPSFFLNSASMMSHLELCGWQQYLKMVEQQNGRNQSPCRGRGPIPAWVIHYMTEKNTSILSFKPLWLSAWWKEMTWGRARGNGTEITGLRKVIGSRRQERRCQLRPLRAFAWKLGGCEVIKEREQRRN